MFKKTYNLFLQYFILLGLLRDILGLVSGGPDLIGKNTKIIDATVKVFDHFQNHPLRFHYKAYLIQIGNRCIHLCQCTSFRRLSRGFNSIRVLNGQSIKNGRQYGSLTFITFIAITFISIFTILFVFFIAFDGWSDTSILLILSFSVDTISVTVTGMSLVSAFVLSKKSQRAYSAPFKRI